MARLADIREPLDLFRGLFDPFITPDDHIDFYANHSTVEGDTFLRLETYLAPNLSRLIIEEYAVRGKMHGCVITAYPAPDTEIPIFFFQVGGVGDRSIAVLDISPTTPDLDLRPLAAVHEKYSQSLGLGPTSAQWLQSISSPYLLHCNYAELDTSAYVEAMTEYAGIWIEQYYRPAVPAATAQRQALVENALYKFKYQLHHHDPAYGIFAKSWGTPVADAFVYLECGDHPAYAPPAPLETDVKPWHDEPQTLLWSQDAQLEVLQAPTAQDQVALREGMEEAALAARLGIITPALLAAFRRGDALV